jgi:uncharacterized OB-fold protein
VTPDPWLPDAPSRRFFAELRARRLATTRCRACRRLWYPPRAWCPGCLAEDLDWERLSGRGRLVAFTTQETALRFRAPEVIGLVELEEGVRLLTAVAGRYEELAVGEEVTVEFVEVEPGLVLHRFVPGRRA